MWGFRNKDKGVYFSRQTYEKNTEVEIVFDGVKKYCKLGIIEENKNES